MKILNRFQYASRIIPLYTILLISLIFPDITSNDRNTFLWVIIFFTYYLVVKVLAFIWGKQRLQDTGINIWWATSTLIPFFGEIIGLSFLIFSSLKNNR